MESPGALLSRLLALPGYEWDTETPPFHSSYDNWHFYGKQYVSLADTSVSPASGPSPGQSPPVRQSPSRSSTEYRPSIGGHRTSSSDSSASGGLNTVTNTRQVVARVSKHALRLEREFQLSKQVVSQSDPNYEHFVRPIELIRLPKIHNGDDGLAISVFEAPGPNYLRELVEFGPNAYRSVEQELSWNMQAFFPKAGQIPLLLFLDFAVGATKCCEILHSQNRIVHGEIRGDAFHFNQKTGAVKMLNFGSGARSFESGLTAAGWYSLSREHGVEHKLRFIAPEQTGRLPAEPDGRTDIYSLGVLFWSMLTGEPAFEGDSPLVIMQNVLSRRIPPVSTKRMDVPDVICSVITKMTQKNIDDRYNSAAGLRYDFVEIQKMFIEGDTDGLKNFKICTKDVSSYFNLPNHQIGRQKEQDQIVRIMDEFCERHKWLSGSNSSQFYSTATFASSSDARLDSIGADENISDVGSLLGSTSIPSSGPGTSKESITRKSGDILDREPHETESLSVQNAIRRTKSLKDKSASDNRALHSSSTVTQGSAIPMLDGASGFFRRNTKSKKNQRCEVVTISGAAGLGKSCMAHSIQTAARSHGYFASAKFDQARKSPFEPVLRLLSSLFRQIFSEADVSTDFHNHIRTHVQPVWNVLHSYLDLPDWLLNPAPSGNVVVQVPARTTQNGTIKGQITVASGKAGNIAADWLRTGGTTKSSRFMNVFLGVLRVVAAQRFICFCIDDLQFADAESLELLSNMVAGRVPLMLVLTRRNEDALSKKATTLVSKSTKIELKPFTEDQTAEYVSATIHRDKEYVLPLVAVIQEKTLGNPFFIREMLDTCYRKRCMYYSWKNTEWEFEIDRIFTEFISQDYGSQINNDFVTKRLQELPSVSRALLSWASLIGSSFSFSFVKKLMAGANTHSASKGVPVTGHRDPVVGLQNALSAFIIMPCDDEDRFRFAHDRYMQAANLLVECYNKTEMHYAITKTMMEHDFRDNTSTSSKSLHLKSQHIAFAIDLLKERESDRSPYRRLLYEAADNALESGARQTAISYLSNALTLLQDNPWDETTNDVSYQETLTLYIRAAESYWYQGRFKEAMVLVETVYKNAKCPVDMAPSWIIESRIYAAQGDAKMAFKCLKKGLAELGIPLPDTTYEACDEEFQKVHSLMQSVDRAQLLHRDLSVDSTLEAMGPLLVELVSAAFWTSNLLFYQVSMVMIQIHIERGSYAQCGIGYLHLGSVAVGRFGMTEYGCSLGDLSTDLFEVHRDDSFTYGRGHSLHSLFFGHLQTTMAEQVPRLVRAWDATIIAGDRILSLLNIGVNAAFRMWSSQDVLDIEVFIHDASAEFNNWELDMRGGAFLVGVRQYARALQGKTEYRFADSVLDDEQHQSETYEDFIRSTASAPERPMAIYWSYKHLALFRFGHRKASIELGEKLVDSEMNDRLICMRYVYSNLLYLSLSYCASIRECPNQPTRDIRLERITKYRKKIGEAAKVNDINYKAWLLLLDAEIADVEGNFQQAVISYEAALDHCQTHSFVLDEALVLELYANVLIRRGAKRPAKRLLLECLAGYGKLNAKGKVDQVAELYQWLLQKPSSLASVDVACQTEIIDTGNTPFKLQQNEDLAARDLGVETSADRTNAWIGPTVARRPDPGVEHDQDTLLKKKNYTNHLPQEFSAMGLDMIDLESILESSQVLSSELKIDKLMGKMAEIITESTTADIVGIVIKDDQTEWSVAAVGTPDGVTSFPEGVGLDNDEIDKQVARQVTTYVLRFKETVFVHNLLEDERFSGVSQAYLAQNPGGKAVIALPILHGNDDELLGSIYVEGPPNKFTARNLTVLRLLVNQISISLANALWAREVEKVSTENAAMVDIQREALTRAREAEAKSKRAEAEAVRNMHLKEEAAKAKSMFLANVSHELRTPLNGVIGMSEMLSGTELTSKQVQYAESIRICADTLLSVINDLLDFTKLDAGKMSIALLPLNLTETIREVVRALSFQNNEKGLHTAEDLKIKPDMLVLGDPVRLHQILMNLLSNSYKFTQTGTVTVKAVSSDEDESNISYTVTVTDTGIGITDEQRKKLFQPFSQVESTSSRSFQGTGLGLSICKALVETLMGGKIWLDSTPGVGTTVGFTIRFKKASKADIANAMIPNSSPDPASPSRVGDRAMTLPSRSPLNPGVESYARNDAPYNDISGVSHSDLRVCIAEDNIINQKIAISYVQRLGFNCEAFVNGRKAIEALERASAEGRPFHIVLMDVQMPVLDGYDATREIRQHKDDAIRNVLIIAMTASAIQGDREKCLDAGMNDYMSKPVRPQTLKALLESYRIPVPAVTTPAAIEGDNRQLPKGVSTSSNT